MSALNPYPYMQLGPRPARSKDKAKFTPSKSLREHIVERLEVQEECLQSLFDRIEQLEQVAAAGAAQTNGQGPGDEQIDGEKIAQIKRNPYFRSIGMSPYRFPSGQRGFQNVLDDAQEDYSDEDPLQKYLRLENEVRMLANMGTVPSKASRNPYQAQADQWENMRNPHKALAKRLPEILGPDGGGGSAGSMKSPQMNMATPAMSQMQPQT